MNFTDFESIGLYIPILDRRDEEQLFSESRIKTFNESKGVLRDFSEHSPLAALLRGFVFAGSEIQFRNQQILDALVLRYLEKNGAKRYLGSKAKTLMRFRLTKSFSTVYTIDKGTEITNVNGDVRFFTVDRLEIPPNNTEAFIEAQSEFLGSKYNVNQFELSYLTKPLAFVGSVTNPEKASDGDEAKTIEESIDEFITENRVQTLASLPSYEDAVTNLLGSDSRAKAIYGLNATKNGFEKGVIHLFAINNLRDPVNARDIQELLTTLSTRVQAGTKLLISAMGITYCESTLVAKLVEGVEPSDAADLLWEAYLSYFEKIEPGQSVLPNKVEHFLMNTQALDYIDELRINNSVNRIPMPNEYTLAQEYSLSMSLVLGTQTYSLARGELEPLNYNPE